MADDHECPAPGCTRRVPRNKLACAPHWYQLPEELRAKVWRTYRQHGMGSAEHTDAMLDAVAAMR